MTSPNEPQHTNRGGGSAIRALLAVAVAVVLVGVAVWFFFLRSTAPDKVSIESAVAEVSAANGASGSSGSDTGSIAGSWKLDTSSGDVDFEKATGTFAGFRVSEELAGVGATEAVGRTRKVEGTLQLTDTSVTSVKVTVDLTSITTNESRRDGKVQQALQTDTFPSATFELAAPVAFDAKATTVKVSAAGKLTIHGVTKDVTVPLEAQKVGSTLVVVGSTKVKLSDFGVEAPKAPIVLSVNDTATIELKLLFVRA